MTPVRWARLTVVGVFVLGLVVVVGPALWHTGSLFRDPFKPAVERTTVETFDAAGNRTGTEVTTTPAGGSLIERSLAAGGVLLLRLAVVSAAAYLAGALVFRTMSGTFPSEIAGVKFAEDAAVALEKTDANLAVVRNEVTDLRARMDASATEIQRAAAEAATNASQLNQRVDAALDAVDRLAEAVAVLGHEVRGQRNRRRQ